MRPGVMNLQQSRTNYISLSLCIWLLQRGPQLQARPCKPPYEHCITPASVGPHPTGSWCCYCEHTHALACTRTQRSDDKAYGGGYAQARLKVPWPRSEVVRICTLVLEWPPSSHAWFICIRYNHRLPTTSECLITLLLLGSQCLGFIHTLTSFLPGIRICRPPICHLGRRVILSWKQMKINRYRKTPFLSFSYLMKRRNLRKMGTTINLLSWGSSLAVGEIRGSWHQDGPTQQIL